MLGSEPESHVFGKKAFRSRGQRKPFAPSRSCTTSTWPFETATLHLSYPGAQAWQWKNVRRPYRQTTRRAFTAVRKRSLLNWTRLFVVFARACPKPAISGRRRPRQDGFARCLKTWTSLAISQGTRVSSSQFAMTDIGVANDAKRRPRGIAPATFRIPPLLPPPLSQPPDKRQRGAEGFSLEQRAGLVRHTNVRVALPSPLDGKTQRACCHEARFPTKPFLTVG